MSNKSKQNKSRHKSRNKKDSSHKSPQSLSIVESAEAVAEEKYLTDMKYGLKELSIDIDRLSEEEIMKWTRIDDRLRTSGGSGTEDNDMIEFIKPLNMGND